jgi:hypothetical protein
MDPACAPEAALLLDMKYPNSLSSDAISGVPSQVDSSYRKKYSTSQFRKLSLAATICCQDLKMQDFSTTISVSADSMCW